MIPAGLVSSTSISSLGCPSRGTARQNPVSRNAGRIGVPSSVSSQARDS